MYTFNSVIKQLIILRTPTTVYGNNSNIKRS